MHTDLGSPASSRGVLLLPREVGGRYATKIDGTTSALQGTVTKIPEQRTGPPPCLASILQARSADLNTLCMPGGSGKQVSHTGWEECPFPILGTRNIRQTQAEPSIQAPQDPRTTVLPIARREGQQITAFVRETEAGEPRVLGQPGLNS